jgi:hypothetical protein
MTGRAFALLLRARSVSKGKWQARCPAHSDRSPSLSICEGKDGRVLVHCFAGCTIEQILIAVRLQKRDLFAGPLPSADQLAGAPGFRAACERAVRAERRARIATIERADKLKTIVETLSAKLARDPADERLALTFHRACNLLHNAELSVDRAYELNRGQSAQVRMAI